MKVHEAFRILGLKSLDAFLLESKGRAMAPSEGLRGIGATTWMLVEAAVHIDEGGVGVIIAGNLDWANELADKCRSMVGRLNPHGAFVTRKPLGNKREMHFAGSGLLYWESERTITGWRVGKGGGVVQEFNDADYKVMAIHRREGPFSEIRELVRQADGSYNALDDKGVFLMALDSEGAGQMADADPYRIKVIR